MCNMACIEFGEKNLTNEDIGRKRVIEVGAYDVNGSLRPVIEVRKPAEYVGVDIAGGYGVDVVCPAEDLLERFGRESFDLVVSTEMLEHVRDWRKVISNFKGICRPGGAILITTRSRGFAYHGWPYDFWRFEPSDMEQIFADFSIEHLEKDPLMPGVFIKARKPEVFHEKGLADMELYSVITDGRVRDIDDRTLEGRLKQLAEQYPAERMTLKGRLRTMLRNMIWKLKKI
ncbi:MAG: class I SAM-dependent methyltransferase [Nitrospirae bacterium]|nr:MAG: class I SAM-dependent methyltransferase [Nitrospirota bacterium]